MAEEGRNFQRFVMDGASVEVQPSGLLGRAGKKPFAANLFNLSRGGLQFLCKKAFGVKVGDRVQLTVNLKEQAGWLKAGGEVVWARDVPGKAFRRVGCRFSDLDSSKARIIREAETNFLSRQEDELAGTTGRLIRSFALPPEDTGRDVDEAQAAEALRFGQKETKTVHRPVKLLSLISMLEDFEVTDELVEGVLEAVSQDLSVEDLFGKEREAEVRPRKRIIEEAPQEKSDEPKPLPVYRIAREGVLHFNEEGLPVAPPVNHLYAPQFDSNECFACEFQNDRMENNGGPVSFQPGEILIFSKSSKVESGDFVFGQVKSGNVFSQMFQDDVENVRLRPLNPKYPEMNIKRTELRNCCRLVGRLQRF